MAGSGGKSEGVKILGLRDCIAISGSLTSGIECCVVYKYTTSDCRKRNFCKDVPVRLEVQLTS